MIPRGRLNTQLLVERKVVDASFDGAGSEAWEAVAKPWAEVQDVLPSRAERQDGGFTTVTGRSRVRMDYRTDITADMRFIGRGRTMQIVSGPAELGNRDGIEFMVEDYSPAGGGA